jgi:hypothetical protein
MQMIINYNKAFLNQINYLTHYNNLISNRMFHSSQNSLSNANPNLNIFLQKKRNLNELSEIFCENNRITVLEKNRVQNLKKNKNVECEDNEFENEIDRIKIISESNSNSNNSIINNFNFVEKENVCNNSSNEHMNDNYNITNNISNHDNDNNNIIIKNKYFNISNIFKSEKVNQNNNNNITNKTESVLSTNTENNNEIKVLKNNKVVYVNSYLLNSPSTSKKLKKLKKITFIGKSKRSSQFRGVSKNGNQWQVLLMFKKSKSYVGSYNSEEIAAKIYDILAIKLRGVKARTNFKYSYEQIKKIGDTDFDKNSKNLEEIIIKLGL